MFEGGYMEKIKEEYLLSVAFRQAIDREELFARKCTLFRDDFKDQELRELADILKDNAEEHIKYLKDKMIKLNIQG